METTIPQGFPRPQVPHVTFDSSCLTKSGPKSNFSPPFPTKLIRTRHQQAGPCPPPSPIPFPTDLCLFCIRKERPGFQVKEGPVSWFTTLKTYKLALYSCKIHLTQLDPMHSPLEVFVSKHGKLQPTFQPITYG